MGNLIKGTHHIALKCENTEMFNETIKFYTEVLGLNIKRSWGQGDDAGAMLDLNGTVLELFATGRTVGTTGSVNHFALATDKVDECIAAVKAAGYKVTMEPTDIVIPATPEFPARIAFCIGPVGEEIEFFCEK